MKIKATGKKLYYLLFGLCFMLVMGGCSHVTEWDESPPAYEVPTEALRQIDVIKLKKAKEKKPVEVAKKKPEKAEIRLSLEECRVLTLENNLDLRVQRINPSIAKEDVNEAEAKFEPTLQGTGSYSRTDMPAQSFTDVIAGSAVNSGYADLGVNIPLKTGGKISFDLADIRTKTNSSFFTFNPSYRNQFSASISQPLLRDAGERTSTYSIRVAQYNSRISEAQAKLQAINIIANTDVAYWQLYAARKLLDVRKQQYDLSKAQYEEAKRFVKVGVKPKIDVITTRADVASKLEAIIVANNNVSNAERSLKRMLNKKGLGMGTKTVLIPSTLPDPVHYRFDRKQLVKDAIKNRMELLESQLNLAMDNDNIEYYKNQLLPEATLEYQYNINGLGSQRSDAYNMLFNDRHHDNILSLQVTIPLGNKAAKSRFRRAVYEREQDLAKKASKEAEIKNDVLDQIDELEANWQSILATRQTTILRDEQYKAQKRQYELGLSTTTDVIIAQTNLADAQSNEIAALTQYEISLTNLAYATGTLLGTARVEWDPGVPFK